MQEPPHSPASTITLQVNGAERRLEVEHRWTLLYVLRELLDLTGSKAGCDRGECGCMHRAARWAAGLCLPDAGGTGGRPAHTYGGKSWHATASSTPYSRRSWMRTEASAATAAPASS